MKSMLDKAGKSHARIKNIMPGDDWVRSFLSRHKDLTQRITQNIKLSRAEVNGEVINDYFNNVEEVYREFQLLISGITTKRISLTSQEEKRLW